MSDAPPLTLGTAGHIDHGKTALVRALTGHETDRLQAERERGFSIELGYAPLRLADGRQLIVAGQKSGTVWALDPDKKGAVVWKTSLARGPVDARGEIIWGGASDGTSAYYGLTSGGFAASSTSGVAIGCNFRDCGVFSLTAPPSGRQSVSESKPSVLDTRRDQMFPVLAAAEIDRLRRFGEVRRFAKGDFLARVGEVSPGLLVFLSGEIQVTPHDRPDEPIVIYHAGQFLGELAQLSGRPALADAAQALVMMDGMTLPGRQGLAVVAHGAAPGRSLGRSRRGNPRERPKDASVKSVISLTTIENTYLRA